MAPTWLATVAPVIDVINTVWPATLAVLVLLAIYVAGSRYLRRRADLKSEHDNIRAQLLVTLAVGIAVVGVILALPIENNLRNSLLQLFGLLVTAVIGLSATTHVSNAFAGLMLRSRRAFRPGDFIRFDTHFGRVTDMGLFHTEVQTEDRDLTTVPNLLLVSSPVTVVRATGTVISATVSLGYDVDHRSAEVALLAAGLEADLVDPFVHIVELGDYSISYRLAGLLESPKTLLSSRSRLRTAMIDALHGAEIEIVSPTFMNQRQVASDEPFIPDIGPPATTADQVDAEAVMFDKADMAESVERLRDRKSAIENELKEVERQGDQELAVRLKRTIETLTTAIDTREREKDQSP